MSKEIESLKRIETTFSMNKQGKESVYRGYTNSVYPFYEDFDLVLKALQRLESIDNANPSEALETLKDMLIGNGINDNINDYVDNLILPIKQALLKAQEQEKENELLKEIIKSLFDRGCPLHQYTDKDFGLTIEVDDECSTMRLGEYKGVDLDAKLKEVLE